MNGMDNNGPFPPEALTNFHDAQTAPRYFHARPDITDTVISQWASERADDAGALARRLIACRADTPARAGVGALDRDKLTEAIVAAIGGDAYDCTRVWEAWSVRMMSDHDFVQIIGDDDRVGEIVDAVLVALQPGEAQGAEPVADNAALIEALNDADKRMGDMGMFTNSFSRQAVRRAAAILRQLATPTAAQVTVAEAEAIRQDALTEGGRAMMRAMSRGGIAVSRKMLAAAQGTYEPNPEYGLSDADMHKAIKAALRALAGEA